MSGFYAYVDESGQDTNGQLFIVTTVVVHAEVRESLIAKIEDIERTSEKARKWSKSNDKARTVYIQALLENKTLKGFIFICGSVQRN